MPEARLERLGSKIALDDENSISDSARPSFSSGLEFQVTLLAPSALYLKNEGLLLLG